MESSSSTSSTASLHHLDPRTFLRSNSSPRMMPPAPPPYHDADREYTRLSTASLAQQETQIIRCLRTAVVTTLLLTTVGVGTGVHRYSRRSEVRDFQAAAAASAQQIVDRWKTTMKDNLEASASLATALTSHALEQRRNNNNNSSGFFPFVTLPDFALRGAHTRLESGSHIVHWAPLVTDEQRPAWEAFAARERGQIDAAFAQDVEHRTRQDAAYASDVQNDDNPNTDSSSSSSRNHHHDDKDKDNDREERDLQQQPQAEEQQQPVLTMYQDGSKYHPRIWSNGAITPKGDEPEGSGPYLPAWQRSPIDPGKQSLLNLNWANTKVIGPGLMDIILNEKKAALRNAVVPIPAMLEKLERNLGLSQYRHQVDDYVDGLSSFLAYPVMQTFEPDSPVAGILATNVYWKVLLSNLLSVQGMVCVVENGFQQTFTYRIDGPTATYAGLGDLHDARFDDLGVSLPINDVLMATASPANTVYTMRPLSDDSHYRIRVYPTSVTEAAYLTNWPVIYTLIAAGCFAFAGLLFLAFSYVVEKRQRVMLEKVIENSHKAAAAERELNEFMSHEVRNPLSAAMTACTFVTTAVNDPNPLSDPETKQFVREDIEVVNSSLNFINDFLRSMLDIHRADRIQVEKTATDLRKDVLEPVVAILYQRATNFSIELECPSQLVLSTDPMRLKQVVLNLARNSVEFVDRGFVRIRASVVGESVCIYVEDSGPGIPLAKRSNLFSKYQESLDLLAQGTGLGLSLSKKLMEILGGDVWLDGTYDSGMEGCPGARFVVQLLNRSPSSSSMTVTVDETPTTTTSSSSSHQEGHAVVVQSDVALLPVNPHQQGDDLSVDVENQLSNGDCHDQSNMSNDKRTLASTNPCVPDGLPLHLRVLFVDDDSLLRKLFVRATKKSKPEWTVMEAASGEAALSLCKSEQFDVIFLDQYMASTEKQLLGTETAQAMRSRGIQSVLCGLSANDVKDGFLRAGADDFILKPFPCKRDEFTHAWTKLLVHRRLTE